MQRQPKRHPTYISPLLTLPFIMDIRLPTQKPACAICLDSNRLMTNTVGSTMSAIMDPRRRGPASWVRSIPGGIGPGSMVFDFSSQIEEGIYG